MIETWSSARMLPVWQPTREDDLFLEGYHDRVVAADDTVRNVWPYLDRYGITRLARQTGLDRIGLPCWAAFRPNSRSLAAAQGKGLTDAAACASAMMEALEVAVAERPVAKRRRASAEQLSADGEHWFSPERLLQIGTAFDTSQRLTWLRGTDLLFGQPVWVPLDVVDMDGERAEIVGICKSSNGLASGNRQNEAIFHALCEIVERDAITMWSLLPDDVALASCVASTAFDDKGVAKLAAQIRAAGLDLSLFDQTSNVGIPAIMAVVGPPAARDAAELEVTAGYGAHPVAARAALRAMTEAVQSRVTSIAASRDDIHSAAFNHRADTRNVQLLSAQPRALAPIGLAPGSSLRRCNEMVGTKLSEAGCQTVAVSLAPATVPFAVVRVISSDLEDRVANINWRPGWRSFDVVERLRQ